MERIKCERECVEPTERKEYDDRVNEEKAQQEAIKNVLAHDSFDSNVDEKYYDPETSTSSHSAKRTSSKTTSTSSSWEEKQKEFNLEAAKRRYNPDTIDIYMNRVITEEYNKRKAKGLTLQKLSIRTGYSTGTLSEYLNGKNGLHDASKIFRLAHNLGISLVDLVNRALILQGKD